MQFSSSFVCWLDPPLLTPLWGRLSPNDGHWELQVNHFNRQKQETKSQNNHPHKHTNSRSSSSLVVPKLVLGLSLFPHSWTRYCGGDGMEYPKAPLIWVCSHMKREKVGHSPHSNNRDWVWEGVFPKGTTGVATRRENRCYVQPKSVCYRETIKSSLGFCFVS